MTDPGPQRRKFARPFSANPTRSGLLLFSVSAPAFECGSAEMIGNIMTGGELSGMWNGLQNSFKVTNPRSLRGDESSTR